MLQRSVITIVHTSTRDRRCTCVVEQYLVVTHHNRNEQYILLLLNNVLIVAVYIVRYNLLYSNVIKNINEVRKYVLRCIRNKMFAAL